MITGKQIKAARVLLDWEQVELSNKAGVSRRTIQNAEAGEAHANTLTAIRSALQAAGIEFICGDRSEGVVLRH